MIASSIDEFKTQIRREKDNPRLLAMMKNDSLHIQRQQTFEY